MAKQIKAKVVAKKASNPGKKFYECPDCGYISAKTFLIDFEGQEYRFCSRCYLEFLKKELPITFERDTK
jgi:transcription elongation factor Elf1